MYFPIFGPFAVPRAQGLLDRSRLADFWAEVEASDTGLSRAVGVYVYSSRHGATYTPWYVGKTCAATGFRGEVFQDHKVQHYLASADFKRGAPHVHLLARTTPGRNAFSGPSKAASREIDLLETMVIGMVLRANRDVRNDRKTWFNRNLCVPGIIGEASPGRRTDAARALRNALKLG